MSEIIILMKTQRLIVDPPTRTVSIMSVGPMGPPGPPGLVWETLTDAEYTAITPDPNTLYLIVD